MHQSHAKTAKNKTRSSLSGEKNGSGPQNPVDKILHRFVAEALQQTPVLCQDALDLFVNRQPCYLWMGCRFQLSPHWNLSSIKSKKNQGLN
jgi:hypothetical protein